MEENDLLIRWMRNLDSQAQLQVHQLTNTQKYSERMEEYLENIKDLENDAIVANMNAGNPF